jgi:hypothetical protein
MGKRSVSVADEMKADPPRGRRWRLGTGVYDAHPQIAARIREWKALKQADNSDLSFPYIARKLRLWAVEQGFPEADRINDVGVRQWFQRQSDYIAGR